MGWGFLVFVQSIQIMNCKKGKYRHYVKAINTLQKYITLCGYYTHNVNILFNFYLNVK